MNSTHTQIENPSFTKFVDAYIPLYREGKAPSIEQIVEQFPHLEEPIRERLSTLFRVRRAFAGPTIRWVLQIPKVAIV